MSNIVKTAIAAGNFKTLIKAIDAAGLTETLSGVGPFTVFAPNDEAFAKLPKEALDGMLANKAQLMSVLKYHVASGNLRSKDIQQSTECKTLEGENLHLRSDHGVMVNRARVLTADIACDNGVIHVIDTVQLPKSYQRNVAA
jgi:uncharacterized surface protein with fasciclin (FAS1) repeats